MNSSFSKTLPFALSLLLIFAACDSDDDPPPPQTIFESYDQDESGAVEYEEYTPLLGQINYRNSGSNLLGFFDEDASEDFSEEELERLVRLTFDPDDDGIEEGEFDTGAEFFFGTGNDQAFDDFDTDGSGTIEDNGEFTEYLGGTELFADFDTSDNDILSPAELANGLFGVLDVDDDGGLDEDEFYEGIETLLDQEVSREPVGAATSGSASALS